MVRGFLAALKDSSKFRVIMALNLSMFAAVIVLSRLAFLHSFGIRDLLVSLAWALGVLVVMPFWLFIRAKTSTRTLTTSPEGIYTQIGKQVGQVPWDKVRVVSPGADYIIIAGRGGNSFFIPNRAFSSALQRNGFMAEIDEWMKRKI
jgi:YcxB-like protein